MDGSDHASPHGDVDRGAPRSAVSRSAVPWLLHDLAMASLRFDVSISERLGLSAIDFLALKYVMMNELPLGPARLGQLLGISSGSATTLVDRLERAGHLERGPHPTDRRRKIVAVTAATQDRVSAELHPVASALGEFVDSLDAGERGAVQRFLSGAVRIHRDADPGRLLTGDDELPSVG